MEPLYTIEYMNSLPDQRKLEEDEYVAKHVKEYVFYIAKKIEHYTACVYVHVPGAIRCTMQGPCNYHPSRDTLIKFLQKWFPRVEAVEGSDDEILIDWTDTEKGMVQNMYPDKNEEHRTYLESGRRFVSRFSLTS